MRHLAAYLCITLKNSSPYRSFAKMSTTFEPQSNHRKTFSMNDMQSEKEFNGSSFSTTNLGLTCVLNERNIQGRVSKDNEL